MGNQVSVEFNLIYRWHSAISAKDEQWSLDFFKQAFGPDVDPQKISVENLKTGFRKFLTEEAGLDPGARTFGGLKRKDDGSFSDSDLIGILTTQTEDVAGRPTTILLWTTIV